MLTFQDIFVPGGFPLHTYNPRAGLRLEETLAEVKKNLCQLVTVTGHTKSGKTVLVRKVLPHAEAIWIEGGTVAKEEDFWDCIIERLTLFQEVEQVSSKGSKSTFGGEATAEANFIFAKGEGGVSSSIAKSKSGSITKTRTLSSKVIAFHGLKDSVIPIVIDDFHFIPFDLQGMIIRALKPLIFDGLPVVIIAIPHRRYDAIKVEREMTGRIKPLHIPVWSDDELAFIPNKGFDLLNYLIPDITVKSLTSEAMGSPHLVQEFCRGICKSYSLVAVSEKQPLHVAGEDLSSVFYLVAESIGRPIFEKLSRGPRQRTDRIGRQLKDGSTVDIYKLVLHALAYKKPGLDSLEYEDIRSAIRAVSVSRMPQLQEVARVLKHMTAIALTDKCSTPVLDFEEEEKKLHITDPFFAFYLRWGNLGMRMDTLAADSSS